MTNADIFAAAVAATKSGKYEEALDQWRNFLLLEPDHANALNNLAHVLMRLGRYSEAREPLQRCLEISPNHGLAFDNLGIVYGKLGETDSSIQAQRRATECLPTATSYYNYGIALASAKKLDLAEAAYRDAISIDPTLTAAHINLGLVLESSGRMEEAIMEMETVAALGHGDVKAKMYLVELLERAGRHDDAIAILRTYIDNHPADERVWTMFGLILVVKSLEERSVQETRVDLLRARIGLIRFIMNTDVRRVIVGICQVLAATDDDGILRSTTI